MPGRKQFSHPAPTQANDAPALDGPYVNRWGKPAFSRPRIPRTEVREGLDSAQVSPKRVGGTSSEANNHSSEAKNTAPKKKQAGHQRTNSVNKLWNPRQPVLTPIQSQSDVVAPDSTREGAAGDSKALDKLTTFLNQHHHQENAVNSLSSRRSRKMISRPSGSTYVPPHLRHSAKRAASGVGLDAGPPTINPQHEAAQKPSGEPSLSASRRARTPPSTSVNDLPPDPAIIHASGPITVLAEAPAVKDATQTFLSHLRGEVSKLPPPSPSPPPVPEQHPEPAQLATSSKPHTSGKSAGSPEHQRRKPSRHPNTQPRQTRWATTKDTKPAKNGPKQWLSTSDDGGWAAAANNEDDPDYDVKQLVDWNGDWMNPPADWEGRGSYSERDFQNRIVRWIEDYVEAREAPIDIGDPRGEFTAIQNGEVANRDWIPIKIGEDLADVWWEKHLQIGNEWLENLEDKPFWKKFTSQTACLLAHLTVPDASLDPSDDQYGRALQDAGSDAKAMETIKKAAMKEKQRKRTKQLEREARLEAKRTPAVPPDFEEHPQKPQVNIFLRLALPADGDHIAQIYNWHVENTVNVPERHPRTRSMMLDRLASSFELKLPVVVAVERAQRNKGNRGLPYVQEKVVGYAIADDYHDIDEAMRYTATIEVYVHPDYFLKGVGRCLLDRMMHLLDPDYRTRGGYEFVGDGPETLAGGRRVIENVIAYVNHDTNNPFRIQWIERWLRQWNFEKVGDLPGIGLKHGKRVSQAIFHVKTGSLLDPSNAL